MRKFSVSFCGTFNGELITGVQGVADRDQIVVQRVRTCGLPIAVIAGGGYTRTAASVVAASLLNLYHLSLISGPSTGLLYYAIYYAMLW